MRFRHWPINRALPTRPSEVDVVADLKKRLKRTVAFWRLVDQSTGVPVDQLDWPKFLSKLEQRRLAAKTTRYEVDGVGLTGTVYTRGELDHLVLTNERDDMPRQQNRKTGEVVNMMTRDETWNVVESSFAKFADFGNVFGLLRSQITAPSPQAIAKWINMTGLIDPPLSVEPVIDPKRWERLNAAGGVTRLEFAAPSVVLDRPVTGPLSWFVEGARHGRFKLDQTISTSRSRKPEYAQERRDLYEAAKALPEQIGVDYLTKAKARIFDEDNQGLKAETIDLLKHRFTIKRDVQLSGGASPSVSEPSAFDAILDAFARFEDDLRAAVREDTLDD